MEVRTTLKALATLATLASVSLPAHADFFGVAHRGGRAQGPENTLEVFQLTIDLGVTPWLETDSWETSDGVLVLHHDLDLCRTTNIDTFPGFDCSNPANNPLGRLPWVRDFTLAELKALDVGSWFGPEFAGARMPTLEEALFLVDGTGVPLLVEVKRPGQAPIIAEILDRTGLNPDNLIVWAREPFSWDEYHGVLPGVRQVTGALNLSVLTDSFLAARSDAGDFGLAIQPVGLTEALVEQIHSYGLLIYGIPTATGADPVDTQIRRGVDAFHVANEVVWQAFLSQRPCTDRTDNDGDGVADSDGIDFDFDGVPDVPPDPGCLERLGPTEIGECQDQLDNDGDGLVDLADPACTGPAASTESAPPAPVPVLTATGAAVLSLMSLALTAGLLARRRPGESP